MEHLFSKAISLVLAPLILISGLFAPASVINPQPAVIEQNLGAALPGSEADFETSLLAPITSSATTMTLTANSVRGGGTKSGYNCFHIDAGSAQSEYVCGTVSGTSVTAMTRGISPSNGTTTVAALQFSHRRGASVKGTDFPVIQILKAQNNGEDTFNNPLSYNSIATTTIAANRNHIASVGLLQDVAFNGAGVIDATTAAKGVGELALGSEIADSIENGSAGPLIIPASLATSTYNSATAGNRVIVTGSNGKFDGNFIPTTIPNNHSYTGTSTFSSGVTITQPNQVLDGSGNPLLWNLLATSTLASNSDHITISNIPTRKHLHIRLYIPGTTPDGVAAQIRFNGDSGSNYSYSSASTTQSQAVGASGIVTSLTSLGFSRLITMDIDNSLGTTKVATFRVSTGFSSTTVPMTWSSVGLWATSTSQQITSITATTTPSADDLFLTGSSLHIYGSAF